jgi:hypothetical protein
MKLSKKTKVFSLEIFKKTRLFNANEELSVIIDRLNRTTNGYLNLQFLLEIEYYKSTLQVLINNKNILVNRYVNIEMDVFIFEIINGEEFSLDEAKKSEIYKSFMF